MDGAWLGSIDISIKKAKTARFFDMPTGEIGKLSQPGGPLYQIEVSNGGLITFPGGIPLKSSDGTVIGENPDTRVNRAACATCLKLHTDLRGNGFGFLERVLHRVIEWHGGTVQATGDLHGCSP